MNTSARRPAGLGHYVAPAFVVGFMALAFAMGWHRHITLENIVAVRDRFHGFLGHHGLLAVLAYIAVYVAAAALALPCGLILTMAGGLLFGWLVGSIAAVLGATLGATAIFVIARSAVGATLAQRAAPWLDKLRAGFKKDAFSYLLFLRLVPAFPFWFVNIAPAILDVPLQTFVAATFVGIIPATIAFACTGAGLDSVVAAAKADYASCVAARGAEACKLTIKATSIVTKELIMALVLLGLAALIPVAMKKWRSIHAAAK
jgi:uncharacterized membrane protein YdjX (TVP38/TMEM64 family)